MIMQNHKMTIVRILSKNKLWRINIKEYHHGIMYFIICTKETQNDLKNHLNTIFCLCKNIEISGTLKKFLMVR